MDRRARTTRLWTVVVIWLGGLVAGFFGVLGATSRYGCSAGDSGFGCTRSGSAVGIVIVLAVVLVVTVVTLLAHDRDPHRMLALGAVGFAALAVCFVAAWALLGTV